MPIHPDPPAPLPGDAEVLAVSLCECIPLAERGKLTFDAWLMVARHVLADKKASVERAVQVVLSITDHPNERLKLLLDAKNYWMDRAMKAESSLAAREKAVEEKAKEAVEAIQRLEVAWSGDVARRVSAGNCAYSAIAAIVLAAKGGG